MSKLKSKLLTLIRPFWRRVFYQACILLALCLLTLAIGFSFFRALTPWVKDYKSDIESKLSSWTHLHVSLQDLQTSWYWFVPVLKMGQLEFTDDQDHHLVLKHLMFGIDLWQSFLTWHLQPGMIYINNADLKLKQVDKAWLINGLELGNKDQLPNDELAMGMFGLLLSQSKIHIRHMQLTIEMADGRTLPIRDLNLKIVNHAGHYRLNGMMDIALKPKTTHLSMVGNLNIKPNNFSQTNGQIYLAIQGLNLQEYQAWLPKEPYQIQAGKGDIELWLDMKDGQIMHLQSVEQLNDLRWKEGPQGKVRRITAIQSNMDWQKQSEGWRASADKIMLTMNGEPWPIKELMLNYDSSNQGYSAYIQTVDLAQLGQLDVPWPQIVQNFLSTHPTGFLSNVQLSWHYGQLDHFLTQFSQLSWSKTDKIPGLTNLTGAAFWQPNEGHIEFDGEHSTLTPVQNLPPLTFDTLNTALQWQNLSQGLRLTLERFVLSHSNMVLSATGAIDNPLHPEANLRLTTDFAAKSAEFWLKYIPDIPGRADISHWIKKTGIARVEHAVGRVTVSGPLADFPFDHDEGTFKVDAYVSGADIWVDADWPLNQDIDADIHVDHRRLEADVKQGKILDVPVRDVNIVVPDIGLNKEVFLLNGHLTAPALKFKDYVFGSPLRPILARWQSLIISDALHLDLELEVPLYTSSMDVLAKGNLIFQDNSVSIQALDNPVEFSGVKGNLAFNELGLTAGRLESSVADNPFTVVVQSMVGEKPSTELRLEGELPITYLNHWFHIPLLSFIQGQMVLSGLWTVYPHETGADKLWLNSSLVGVAMHLPPPLNKESLDIKPLSVDLSFRSQDQINIKLDYAQFIQANIDLKKSSKLGWVETGDIVFGRQLPPSLNANGLKVSGHLPTVDVQAWDKVLKSWPKGSGSVSLGESVKQMELSVDEMQLLGQELKNLQLTLQQSQKDLWSGHVNQDHIEGNYSYAPKENLLSMHLSHLSIDAPKKNLQNAVRDLTIKPESIPNIDMDIEQCDYHGINLGQIGFKSESHPNHWILNQAYMITDAYQLRTKGDWVVGKNQNESNFKGTFIINNFSKSLERWKLNPSLDAHKGQADIELQWSAPFYDFNLKNLNGQMYLVLKDGRISHLDAETEKKLGLAKILSILSLQTIPRRLKLDFSDLSEKGYSFDEFKGNFNIEKGVMSTQNSTIDGPVAYAKITGDFDLVNQLFDLNLNISPHIGASLPVVASLVTGPIGLIPAWFAMKVIDQAVMQKISAYTYKVSGPWSNPVVQQVAIVKSKHGKTNQGASQ